MEVELYARPGSPEAPLDESSSERQQLLTNTGFTQVRQYEHTHGGRIEMAGMVYSELTGKTLTMWRRFLPTAHDPSGYRFDQPPTEALEAIQQAQQMQCFDRIEIWTPEGNRVRDVVQGFITRRIAQVSDFMATIDPMAVGVIRGPNQQAHFFPIVRWGESLLPEKQIRAHVRRTRWGVKVFAALAATIVLAVIGGVLFGAFVGVGAMIGAIGWWSLVVAIVAGGGLGAWGYYNYWW